MLEVGAGAIKGSFQNILKQVGKGKTCSKGEGV